MGCVRRYVRDRDEESMQKTFLVLVPVTCTYTLVFVLIPMIDDRERVGWIWLVLRDYLI